MDVKKLKAWQRHEGPAAGGVWMAAEESLDLIPESSREARAELWIAVTER